MNKALGELGRPVLPHETIFDMIRSQEVELSTVSYKRFIQVIARRLAWCGLAAI